MNVKTVRYLLIGLLAVILMLILNNISEFSTIRVKKYPTPNKSETTLSHVVSQHKSGEIPFVDLSTITTFSWDRVYIFGPYTELSRIDAVAGRSWQNSCLTTINSYDGFSLLVFTKDSQAVGCIEFPRDIGDFAPLEARDSGFAVDEARFTLDETGHMIWVNSK